MSLIEKNNLFKGYADLLLLGVYADKVVAEIVRKEKDGVNVIASAVEPMEGEFDENSAINAEKIRLNCEKAIQRLPPENILTVKNAACVLGGGISNLSFAAENKIREKRDKKISNEEITALVGEDKVGSVVIEKRFLVDGFAIEEPIGMDGKEITALISRVSVDDGLEKALGSIAGARGMRYEGALDARLAFLRSGIVAPKDYCAVFIFSGTTTICVVRGGLIAAVVEIEAGYGIITEKVARTLNVGSEEGKSIVGKFRNNELNQGVVETVKAAFKEAEAEMTNKIRAALLTIDKENLLPGNVFAVIAGDWPELEKTLSDVRWLAGLPIDRNASVHIERFNLPTLLN